MSEERVTLEAGVMVREARAELHPSVAVITAVVALVTDVVATANASSAKARNPTLMNRKHAVRGL